jgi:ribose/xylose/arabinose/galactoside ABC-type transport system permease subunit
VTFLRSRAAPAAILLLALLVANALFVPRFLQLGLVEGRVHGPLVDVLRHGAPLLLLATGMAPVIATRGVDLSVGSVMALASSAAAASLSSGDPGLARGGTHTQVAVLLALALGLAAGLANGALVARMRIPPIVATLALLVACRGVAQLLSGGGILAFESEGLAAFARGSLLGIPAPFLLAALVLAATAALLRRTTFGLHVEATGDNERAARLSGIRVARVELAVYALSGLCAAAAGLLVAADVRAADASHVGLYLELDAILAVVVGGTSLDGGRASLLGAALGALAIQTLSTTLLLLGVGTPAALAIKAAGVLLAVLAQTVAARRRTAWA